MRNLMGQHCMTNDDQRRITEKEVLFVEEAFLSLKQRGQLRRSVLGVVEN